MISWGDKVIFITEKGPKVGVAIQVEDNSTFISLITEAGCKEQRLGYNGIPVKSYKKEDCYKYSKDKMDKMESLYKSMIEQGEFDK